MFVNITKLGVAFNVSITTIYHRQIWTNIIDFDDRI